MSDTQAEMEQALDRIARAIDRSSSVSVSTQLRGGIEFGIASGELPANARLPSVRAMASRCGLSPVTVSGVYAALQEAGHIEAHVGSGTFVRSSDPAKFGAAQQRLLDRRIADLIRLARECGIGLSELAMRITMTRSEAPTPMRLLLVGNFHDATEAYAEAVRPSLPEGDTLRAVTLSEISDSPPEDVDVVLAPRTLRSRAQALFPGVSVVDLTLIPNEATRVAMASIPTEARVVGYTYFPEFLAIMKAGIMRFAPHVSDLSMVVRGEEGVEAAIAEADVLIYATGAEYLLAGLSDDQVAFEYRHTPGKQSIRRDLLPAIEAIRAELKEKDSA
ncbi:GntR family transcriptional regulator [Frigidibacter sp. ROC022]|uniref:GntR family transcriptional regulator n=1 Tax=Frigidibacter sp. ROC022 TaxID=2971796 RepID=UPI00215A9549|nr:GntR family transcriptional regulator [Frigidibacter sp. ROC022]MCR8723084.1 GntR family transcriptional regulator [Frigidibacter sp. ROC022]